MRRGGVWKGIVKTRKTLEKIHITAGEILRASTMQQSVEVLDNIAARLKYPDQPEKFADSEIELHEEIEKLKTLAGAPELYPS
ncbi:hypothetical protein L1887_31034 [Cichorium endivia]|nr:hypothetical protein L1887_31034 [Cichorium endivia]